jgi:hypothetical protein
MDSCGRSQCGNGSSVIEPRFSMSMPLDKSKNNAREVILKFDTYAFSSWVEVGDCLVEVSEDGGATYATAYAGVTFVAPYDGAASKIRRPDSQRLRFYIQKTSLWPVKETIVVRMTTFDDFGQAATKVAPVLWD